MEIVLYNKRLYVILSIYNKVKIMGNFYQIIIKKDGTIVHDIFAMSHADLVAKYLKHNDIKENNYFRAVYCPKDKYRLDDVDNYTLINCEIYYPDWFGGEFKEQVISDLKTIINSMIVKTRKKLLLHEGVILTNTSVIDEVKHCVIFAMYDNARIKALDQTSEVQIMTDDTVIDEMCDGSKILEMYGYSEVKIMRNYSKIVKMYGQARVNEMHNNSRIAILKGEANIEEMHEDAKADRLKHMSRVDEMHGHSVIEEMWDRSVVEKMFDDSRINFMDEESKVLEMYGNSMVDEMHGNAVVERLYEDSLVRKLNDAAQILSRNL